MLGHEVDAITNLKIHGLCPLMVEFNYENVATFYCDRQIRRGIPLG